MSENEYDNVLDDDTIINSDDDKIDDEQIDNLEILLKIILFACILILLY